MHWMVDHAPALFLSKERYVQGSDPDTYTY
jgi:hypothetical protein